LALPTVEEWPAVEPKDRPPPTWPATIDGIKAMICWRYDITMAELIGQQRVKRLIRPRKLCCYLCARHTGHSLPAIARRMGPRDHTTILHARNSVVSQRATDEQLDAELTELEKLMGVA
jgi:chromosomal replication initiator protein